MFCPIFSREGNFSDFYLASLDDKSHQKWGLSLTGRICFLTLEVDFDYEGSQTEIGKVAPLERVSIHLNPLYTSRDFHYNMLDKSICHFRGVVSTLSLILFLVENPVSKQCRL